MTSVIGQIVVGLLFALVISNKHLKGGTVLRTFLLVPYVVPAIVIALVTRWMLSGDYGIISVWLQNMGVLPHRQTLLALPKPALAVVIIVNIWRSYPFPMLIYWAALKGIDAVMYEAARGGRRKFLADILADHAAPAEGHNPDSAGAAYRLDGHLL